MNPVAGLKIERALISSTGRPPEMDVGMPPRPTRCLPSRRGCRRIRHVVGPDFFRTERQNYTSVHLSGSTRSRNVKYGMNLLLWTGHVAEEHFPLLAALKKTGYDG